MLKRIARRVGGRRSAQMLTAAVLAVAAPLASAGTPLYWDGGTADLAGTGDGVSQGGAGTWNTSTLNWDSGAGQPYIAWPNTITSDAVFAGTSGTVTLGTSITAGNVSIGGATGYTIATGTNTLTTNAGVAIPTTGLLQTISGAGGLNLTGGAGGNQTFNIASGSTLVISGALSGSDTLTNAAAGRVGLTGSSNPNFTGKFVINAGVLGFTSDAALGAVPGSPVADAITLNGGLLQDGISNNASTTTFGQSATFTINANRGITLGTGGGTVQIGYGAANTLTVAGPVSGTGALAKTDSGTLVLTNAANSYTGATTVNSGVLAVTVNGALGTTAGGTTVNGNTSTLDLRNVAYTTLEGLTVTNGTLLVSTGSSSWAGSVSGGANANTINVAGTALTLSGGVSGGAGGSFNKIGTGTLTISGTGDNSGGRLKVTAGTAILAKTSNGSVHSVGANGGTDYALILNGGTAQFGGTGGDQIYINSAVQMLSGTLDMNGLSEGFDGLAGTGGTIVNNLAATTATLTIGQNGSVGSPTYSGSFGSGAGVLALVKTGNGTQTLGGASTFTGGTTVGGGTLSVLVNAALGTGGVTVQTAAVKLSIGTGVTDAVADTATLSLAGGGTAGTADNGYLDLTGGANETVGNLILGGVTQAAGTYGSTASTATFKSDEYFSGTGVVTNLAGAPVPEPGTVGVLAVGAVGCLARRRRRAR